MLRLLRSFSGNRFLWLIPMLLVAWESYDIFGPEPAHIGPERQTVAERVCMIIADEIPAGLPVSAMAILSLNGDEKNFVTDLLREKIAYSGKYRINEKSVVEKVLKRLR